MSSSVNYSNPYGLDSFSRPVVDNVTEELNSALQASLRYSLMHRNKSATVLSTNTVQDKQKKKKKLIKKSDKDKKKKTNNNNNNNNDNIKKKSNTPGAEKAKILLVNSSILDNSSSDEDKADNSHSFTSNNEKVYNGDASNKTIRHD